jgi:NitT/TauT family transport system ATP-binding protein
MAFQNPVMLPWRTVLDNLLLPLEIVEPHRSRFRKHKQDYRARAEALLGSVGLSGMGQKYPWQLSGGMQQRVSIARALAVRPSILVMDEPFASVDAQTRFDLEDLVLKVRDDFGITTLMVTHDIDEAVYLSDEIVVLHGKPAKVRDVVKVDIPFPRSQMETRNDHRFAELRTRVYGMVRGLE